MTETKTLLLDWDAFERDYIASRIPHLIVVRTTPSVVVFVDQDAARIGARFELPAHRASELPISLAEIHVDSVVQQGKHQLEVWTDAQSLFANFYRLITEIMFEVVDDGADPSVALTAAILRWETLLSRPSIMSDETQTGLFGELWLLERLITSSGSDALEAWVGPSGEAHDFRLGNVELEVKTTSGTRRVHTINGIGQLEPSRGCTLFLLSLKMANAGTGGRSLPEIIVAIEHLLSTSSIALASFRTAITLVGYDPAKAHLYPRRRRLREAAVLIPVVDGVPRLTPDALSKIEPRFVTERIERVVYSIDVEGLGFADGTLQFEDILPAVSKDSGVD